MTCADCGKTLPYLDVVAGVERLCVACFRERIWSVLDEAGRLYWEESDAQDALGAGGKAPPHPTTEPG